MSDYSGEIARIRDAKSLEEIQALAREFPAISIGEGGILYSRPVGVVSSELIAKELSEKTGLPIINDTPRARFLGDESVSREITQRAMVLFEELGETPDRASEKASSLLYGDDKVVDGPTSLRNCLWGEASHDFASSLRGDIRLVASNANTLRIFGAVELPATASNPGATSLAGMPRGELAAKLQQLGPDGVIGELQGQFIKATPEGLFVLPPKEGERPSRVIASREFVERMGVDARRLSTASELHFAGLPVAPTGLGQVHPEWEAARAGYLSEPILPKLGRATPAVGMAGLAVAAAAIDAHRTGERMSTDLAQDNPSAVRSQATHLAGRTIGGIGAGALPIAAGASGVPALGLAVADGILLTEAYEHGAKWIDRNRIVFQTDKDGVQWEFTGKQWVRDDLRADLVDDGRDRPLGQKFAALPDKARELSYHASVEAVSQAIGRAEPQNPFAQPANADDTAHLKARDWSRDSATGQWSRMTADEVDRNDALIWNAKPEIAGPARAAELDRQALRTIDRNLSEGAAGLAAQYSVGHKRGGYDQFGPEPDVVRTALNPNALEGYDGKQYQRDARGQWTHGDTTAQGNVALALEATRERMLPALEQLQARLGSTPAWKPPTPEELDRAQLAQAYRDRGWNTQLHPGEFEARHAAVQRTREAAGVSAQTTSLTLGADASGNYSLDSPILHMHRDADGVVRIAATTTQREIAQAVSAVRARDASPAEAPPALVHESASPQAREIREQAQREANRQGLSKDEAQQAVAAPSPTMGGGRRGTESRDEDTQRDRSHERKAENAHVDPATTTSRPTPPRPTDPRDPDHPDHGLYKQIEAGVAKADASAGRSFDATSERLAMSAFHDAKATGMTSADHVVLNNSGALQRDGSRAQANTLLIAIQGDDPCNPAAKRSITDVKQAVEQPLEKSLQKVNVLEQQKQQSLAQQQGNQTQDDPGPKGPRR